MLRMVCEMLDSGGGKAVLLGCTGGLSRGLTLWAVTDSVA